jgi:hypothetical protein
MMAGMASAVVGRHEDFRICGTEGDVDTKGAWAKDEGFFASRPAS